tara:strand:- start:299 stop:811 length:513 start_codon:yes stop_codon:yes gene_type:complete
MLNKFVLFISIIILFLLYFNRSPNRKNRLQDNIIVSPCDGKVTYSNGRNISIFLSVFDVHVQYVPIKSKVIDIKTVNVGNHILATNPKSSHNEGVRVVFRCQYGDIVVTQRVGFFVRRIINSIKKNDILNRSDKYGFITFGSRVDIILPENKISCLKVGDKLIGGITRIS